MSTPIDEPTIPGDTAVRLTTTTVITEIADPPALPETGAAAWDMAIVGGLLLLAGVFAVLGTNRKVQ